MRRCGTLTGSRPAQCNTSTTLPSLPGNVPKSQLRGRAIAWSCVRSREEVVSCNARRWGGSKPGSRRAAGGLRCCLRREWSRPTRCGRPASGGAAGRAGTGGARVAEVVRFRGGGPGDACEQHGRLHDLHAAPRIVAAEVESHAPGDRGREVQPQTRPRHGHGRRYLMEHPVVAAQGYPHHRRYARARYLLGLAPGRQLYEGKGDRLRSRQAQLDLLLLARFAQATPVAPARSLPLQLPREPHLQRHAQLVPHRQ
jgi:hypothetical protein